MIRIEFGIENRIARLLRILSHGVMNPFVTVTGAFVMFFGILPNAFANTCSILVTMANGTELPRNLSVQLFANEKPVLSSSLNASGSTAVNLSAGAYTVQISEKRHSFINVGKLLVSEKVACSYATALQGQTVSQGTRIESRMADVQDLQAPPAIRQLFSKGIEAFSRGELHKAEEIFLKITAQAPRLDRAYNVLGIIAEQKGDLPKARLYFENAVELNPHSDLAVTNLAKTMMQQHDYQTLLSFFETRRFQIPDTRDMRSFKVDANYELGRCNSVLADVTGSLPTQFLPFVHVIAARCWQSRHEFEKAKLEYQVYLSQAPNGPMRTVVTDQIRVIDTKNMVHGNILTEPVPSDSYLPRR